MPVPEVSLVVAYDRNRVIGTNGGLPWRLPADLKQFRAITMGKPIIMGRRTYESIGRPLPGRTNIILSASTGYAPEGCVVYTELDAALSFAAELHEEAMVIGGAALYRASLERAQRIYLTEVHADVTGEVYFPAYDRSQWHEVSRTEYAADSQNVHPYAFVLLERKPVKG